MPDEIKKLEAIKASYSSYFYASRSFTGCMSVDDAVSDEYQRSISVEEAGCHILLEENSIQKRIDNLTDKYRLFKQVIGDMDMSKVIHGLGLYEVTNVEYQVLEAIGEVNYYLEEHRKTEERLKGFGLNEEQQAQMADVGSQLLNRIKELAL